MSDNYDNYQKSVAKAVDRWGKKVDEVGKKLAPIDAELDKLEENKSPSPDEKKHIQELQKKRETLRKEIDQASLNLHGDLIMLGVPPQADEKDLVKFPAWLKEIIKRKGLPLGKNVSIAPDVSFDAKTKKLKSVGITIRW